MNSFLQNSLKRILFEVSVQTEKAIFGSQNDATTFWADCDKASESAGESETEDHIDESIIDNSAEKNPADSFHNRLEEGHNSDEGNCGFSGLDSSGL